MIRHNMSSTTTYKMDVQVFAQGVSCVLHYKIINLQAGRIQCEETPVLWLYILTQMLP